MPPPASPQLWLCDSKMSTLLIVIMKQQCTERRNRSSCIAFLRVTYIYSSRCHRGRRYCAFCAVCGFQYTDSCLIWGRLFMFFFLSCIRVRQNITKRQPAATKTHRLLLIVPSSCAPTRTTTTTYRRHYPLTLLLYT